MDAFSASLERSKAFVHDWAKKEVGASERPGASGGGAQPTMGIDCRSKKDECQIPRPFQKQWLSALL